MTETVLDLAPPPASDRSPNLTAALEAAATSPDPRAAAVSALRAALNEGRPEALSPPQRHGQPAN
ncbi:MAG: hypothetical protein AAFP78_07265, partial [Pseudomonadota bacterium]